MYPLSLDVPYTLGTRPPEKQSDPHLIRRKPRRNASADRPTIGPTQTTRTPPPLACSGARGRCHLGSGMAAFPFRCSSSSRLAPSTGPRAPHGARGRWSGISTHTTENWIFCVEATSGVDKAL